MTLTDAQRADVAMDLARFELEVIEALCRSRENILDTLNRAYLTLGFEPLDEEPLQVTVLEGTNFVRQTLVELEDS